MVDPRIPGLAVVRGQGVGKARMWRFRLDGVGRRLVTLPRLADDAKAGGLVVHLRRILRRRLLCGTSRSATRSRSCCKRFCGVRLGTSRNVDDVEFATMTYVDWFNCRRLHGQITDGPNSVTPAEHETSYYSQHPTANKAVNH